MMTPQDDVGETARAARRFFAGHSSVSVPRGRTFSSFWMAGFESACHITRRGTRLDLLKATAHDSQADADYGRLQSLGISVVRDAVRWHLIERRPGQFDFSSLDPLLVAARRRRMQVVWNLCHYGWPEGLDVLSPAFVERFTRFCATVARHIRDQSDEVPFYTPINEISFLSWAAAEVGYMSPCLHGQGLHLKRQLVRASLAAMDAIRAIDPRVRFATVEPLIHVVPDDDVEGADRDAERYRQAQFEAWDMLAGTLEPELGGAPAYLDLIGVNYYHDNQWSHPSGRRLQWDARPAHKRRRPLSSLLGEVAHRYRRPIFIAETGHVGSGRARWLREITREARLALDAGVALEAICLFPIIDRPDWDQPSRWHHCGLWDVWRKDEGDMRRVLDRQYADELWQSQLTLGGAGLGEAPPFPIEPGL